MSFAIREDFEGPWTEGQRRAFQTAKDRWVNIILARNFGRGAAPAADELHVTARIGRLDSKGGLAADTRIDFGSLLGPAAGPAEHLPTNATIVFDQSDLEKAGQEDEQAEKAEQPAEEAPGKKRSVLLERGFLGDLFAHEIGHALGFSEGIWKRKHLLDKDPESHEPVFTGREASRVFGKTQGQNSVDVPLETFGHGAFVAHWRQAWFHSELMTFLLEDDPNRISPLTVWALQDLGYRVDPEKAETNVVTLRDTSVVLPEEHQGADPDLTQPRRRALSGSRWLNCRVGG
jgi:hypothetical protein